MFEVDFVRGFAYKENKGFIIQLCKKGLYIRSGFKKIMLTAENTKVI